jgi:hypothetical protein
MIKKFCDNPTKDNFKKLDKSTQDEFIRFSEYCIKKGKGNLNLANKVLENKRWDILITAADPQYMDLVKTNDGLKVPKQILDNWLDILDSDSSLWIKLLFRKYIKYFLQDDNRFKIIQTLAQNDPKIFIQNITKKKKLYKPEKGIQDQNYIKGRNYVPGIYTHYLYDDLSYDGDCWSYGCNRKLIYGISTDILKDQPWIACDRNMQGLCFKNLRDGFYSKGNLENKPNMEKIKKHINMNIDLKNKSYQPPLGDDMDERFYTSHEIIFNEVPLKYIKVIFTTKEYVKKAIKIFKNIPVIEIPENWRDRKNYKGLLAPYANTN